ncbi:hypothetical protein L1987_05397 [Smallanthus sonchifolius]|uniref:Uncharacterized protein n=1 Tax=Smallanthus sonchifolius TaxID=185202 RepID=A0ACB9JV86_9ASTR|nr:hypothetical protein L1987_05397 [Smallanthus sonchifolius]
MSYYFMCNYEQITIPVESVDQDEHDQLKVENQKLKWKRKMKESCVVDAELCIRSLKSKLKAVRIDVECAGTMRCDLHLFGSDTCELMYDDQVVSDMDVWNQMESEV